jgi:hypothetical protein
VRPALVVLVVLLAACRREAATGTATTGRAARSAPAAAAASSTRVTDEELVAFTRWQREYMELFGRHRAEIDAVGSDDPDAALRDTKAFEARVAEVVARQMPIMKAQLDRVPLTGAKAELATEALGGLFHFGTPTNHFELVIARDEVRLDAARRRFGAEAIDAIVAREPLVLAALQQP